MTAKNSQILQIILVVLISSILCPSTSSRIIHVNNTGQADFRTIQAAIDGVTSPCIDAGDPNSPVAFEPFPNGGIINMGAYGGSSQASKSPSGLHSKYGGGTGEPNTPFLIYTAEHLNDIGAEPNDWDKYFKLMANIDLFGYSYDRAPIAPDTNDIETGFQGTSFTGAFDGNGHNVSQLSITGASYLGLFGQMESAAQIKNLGVVDVNITGSGDYFGALAGFNHCELLHRNSQRRQIHWRSYRQKLGRDNRQLQRV